MAVRREVLRSYRHVLKMARSWEAAEKGETAVERNYIQEEARRLFRKNKDVRILYDMHPHYMPPLSGPLVSVDKQALHTHPR